MKPAISNIALPSFAHEPALAHLAALGFAGLEVAPSKVWQDTAGVRPGQARAYRRAVEGAGLRVAGLHSLFYDQPGLGLFRGPEVREKTFDFLVFLSALCADLGGVTLIYGSPPARARGGMPLEAADQEAVDFFGRLARAMAGHGTCLCLEALGASETDYGTHLSHILRLVRAVGEDAFRVQLDAKAAAEAGEIEPATLERIAPHLVHVHVNDPGLGVVGGTGRVDHDALGRLLRAIDYQGYVSVEQRMVSPDDPLAAIRTSREALSRWYA